MSDDAPKSAIELAMQRLRQKDLEAGVQDRPVSEEQKSALAEIRKVYEAKFAEREILHHSKLRGLSDPEARSALEQEYQRDRDRLGGERDRKVDEIRRRSQ